MGFYVAADTGGTFTDVVAYDRDRRTIHFGKTLTTYRNLVEGVIECVCEMQIPFDQIEIVKHGTTHIINAFVQRLGARTALVSTRGFRDVLEIGRANRPIGFDLHYARGAPLVPRPLSFEVGGRLDTRGDELEAVDEADVRSVAARLEAEGVEAVAVSLLNAYVDPRHEAAVAALLRDACPALFVTTGAELTRELSEFERASTAVANAYVGPKAKEYLDRFEHAFRERGFNKTFYMMASNGGVLTLARSAAQPVSLLESGPVGGCIGAGVYADALGLSRVIAFDMGGTTAKCALVENGRYEVQPTYYVGGYDRGFPVRSPILDIVEVGAGGGSIASVDEQGRLHVGPRSAGSEPGPVAFGRGGVEPTVTDANLVLGRISADAFLGGALQMDLDAARAAIGSRVAAPLGYAQADDLDTVAAGILQMATTTMAGAIKEITIERGLDAREFELFAFGGGGPLHAATLARELHIPRVVIPPQPGNFSALGMLLAAARIDDTRTFLRPLDLAGVAGMGELFADIEAGIRATLRAESHSDQILFERAAELRYRGQKHSLRLDLAEHGAADDIARRFHLAYERRYGHSDDAAAVEFVALKATGYSVGEPVELAGMHRPDPTAPAEPKPSVRSVYYAALHQRVETPIFRRDRLPLGFAAAGPAIIEDYGSTIVVEPFDRFEVGRLGEVTIFCE
ncbi:MAG TPA: hydantoinase/oxoprolinase family protein [Caulobacteraceae bacterium]|nr:hydantoinase/oxoprolinase family protein [Caulobacteraceae bacterium]